MSVPTLLEMVAVMGSSYVLHELGHYYIARKHGMNPHFTLNYENPLRMGVAVTYSVHLENPSNKEVIQQINLMLKFAAGGIFGILPLLIYGTLTSNYLVSSMIISMLLMYSLYEVVSSIETCKMQFTETNPTSASVVKE